MWQFDERGFFSIVRKPGDGDHLTVRARCAEDLERLRRTLPELGPTVEGGGTDYPFRARVPAKALAADIARQVEGIGYDNYKERVAQTLGSQRAAVCHKVCAVVREGLAPPRKPQGKAMLVSKYFPLPPVPERAVPGVRYGGVLVDDAGRVLLRKPRGHFGGYHWTHAKGLSRPGETPEQAALREVREETGWEAEIVKSLPGRYAGTTSETVFFVMRPVRHVGGLRADETEEVVWVTPREAWDRIGETTVAIGRDRDRKALADALSALLDEA